MLFFLKWFLIKLFSLFSVHACVCACVRNVWYHLVKTTAFLAFVKNPPEKNLKLCLAATALWMRAISAACLQNSMSSSLLLIKHTPSSTPTARPHTVLLSYARGLPFDSQLLSIHVKSVTLHPGPPAQQSSLKLITWVSSTFTLTNWPFL